MNVTFLEQILNFPLVVTLILVVAMFLPLLYSVWKTYNAEK